MKKVLLLALILSSIAFAAWAAGTDDPVQGQEQADQKWAPEYGPNGDLLNAEPSITPFGYNEPRVDDDPPMIQTVVFLEDFNDSGWNGDNPPTGWAVIDSGSNNFWNTYDWSRLTSSTWGSYARVGATASELNDDWFITPSVDFSAATLCSLTCRLYYDDNAIPEDSLIIFLSDDGGSTWGYTVHVFTDADSGASTRPAPGRWDISSFAAGKSNLKAAFVYRKQILSSASSAGFDNVRLVGNDTELLDETLDFAWGVDGSNPPDGWSILDFNPPYSDAWNNNDWHYFNQGTWGRCARVMYYTPIEQNNDWLISPPLDFSTPVEQIVMSFNQLYYDNTTLTDTAFVLGSNDGGASFPYVVMALTEDRGATSDPDKPMLDITSWANGHSAVKLALKYVGHMGQYWWVDSVMVETFELPDNDVASINVNQPVWATSGFNWPVNIQVQNVGTNTATFEDSIYILRAPRNALMYQNFNFPTPLWKGNNPPVGWAVIDSGNEATPVWNNNDWHGYINTTSGDTLARIYNSPVELRNDWLITPAVNAASIPNVGLTFRTFFYDTAIDDTCYILGTTDDWATVHLIDRYTRFIGSTSNLTRVFYDISSWAGGHSNVKVAFKYSQAQTGGLYWYIDDAEIYQPLPPSIEYINGQTVTNLASTESRALTYPDWVAPTAGDYIIKNITSFLGDSNKNNDTLTFGLTVYNHREAGGPDAGNYTWASDKDGGTGSPYNWIDISSVGTPVPLNLGSTDDRYTGAIPIGFTFNFYDQPYSNIYLNENGLASFTAFTTAEASNYHIPNTSGQENVLAFLWDDLSGIEHGGLYVYSNNVDSFIVTYENWDFETDHGQRIDMQAILCSSNGTIKYQYKTLGPKIYSSHTIGIENAAGTIGLEYIYNNVPTGNLPLPSLALTFRYNPPGYDASAQRVVSPGLLQAIGQPIAPRAMVANLGSLTAPIPVYFDIYDSTGALAYNATTTVSPAPFAIDTAVFATFTAALPGTHRCSVYTALPGDLRPSNDYVVSTFIADHHYGRGGPDVTNYRWYDNTITDPNAPTYGWIDITVDGTFISAWDNGNANDGRMNPVPMGLPGGFWFYGAYYTDIVISTNGWLSFLPQTSNYATNYSPPSTSGPAAGVFVNWDDLDGSAIGRAYYKSDPVNNRFIVSWIDWSYYYYPLPRNPTNFQVIFDADDSSVVMQYGPCRPGPYEYDMTVGVQNEAWNVGLRYYHGTSVTNPGTPRLNLPYDGLAIKFKCAPFGHDIQTQAFLALDRTGPIGTPITPEVQFLNFGSSAETGIPVRLTIEPGAYVNTQIIPSMTPGQTSAVTFANFTPVSGGLYTLTAIAQLAADQDRGNDTLRVYYAVYDTLMDLEGGPGGFLATGDWECGTPSGDGPGSAYSGVNCWATYLAGDYAPGVSTLEFLLNVGTYSPALTITHWYETENRYDGGNFAVSLDQGNTWTVIEPLDRYDTTGHANNPLGQDRMFTGTNQGYWETSVFPLTGYNGQSILARFGFGADISAGYPGWYIDDIGLVDCQMPAPNMDYSPTSLSATVPVGGNFTGPINISNTGQVTLRISASTIQNPPVTRLAELPRLIDPRPDMRVARGEVTEENKDEDDPPMLLDILCPGTTIYGQQPTRAGDAWVFGTSDSTLHYRRYESLAGINTDVTELRFWGIDAYLDTSSGLPMWRECNEIPASFEIIFYHNNQGLPGGTYAIYEMEIAGIPTGRTFSGFLTEPLVQKEYVATFDPPLTVYGGWVSIQSTNSLNDCLFMWQNSLFGDGMSLMFDGTTYTTDAFDLSICLSGTAWLFANPPNLEIAPGGNGVINATMDAADLSGGIYTGAVRLSTNDPQGTVSIPVTFTVEGGGCDYMVGDINGNGAANGIDVVYGVTYLKGGATPKDTCDCRPDVPTYPFYGAMDVNGNCATNGIDITFFVAYLKGMQPALKWCLSCPPAGALVAPAIEPPALKARKVEVKGMQ